MHSSLAKPAWFKWFERTTLVFQNTLKGHRNETCTYSWHGIASFDRYSVNRFGTIQLDFSRS
jgi:hypothetical protein